MFKNSGIWRTDKNKVKIVFKLQFRATQLPQVGAEALMVSLVPADSGKPTVRSEKATHRDGSCFWENPVFETVKFNRAPKSGRFQERIYFFVLGTGSSSKAGNVGEASLDFSTYADSTRVSLVSLPLKNSKTEAVLHVSIQRIHESSDQREVEETENPKENSKDHSLRTQLGSTESDGTIKSSSVEDVPFNNTVAHNAELNGNRRASSGSDLTLSSSESSSGVEIPWEPQSKNGNIPHLGAKPNVSTALYEGNHRSNWEWIGNSALEASIDDSLSTPRETNFIHNSDEAPDIVIARLKTETAALSRQTEMSELELQTLRKQIVKESKRGQDLFKEVVCLKEERDAMKGELENLKASRRFTDDGKFKANLHFEGGDSLAMVEELRQELNHARELNANLQIQLRKMQESNSELILAVRDLDEMLEQKNRETLNISDESSTKFTDEKLQETGSIHRQDDGNDDEEQKALEDLVKEHGNAKEAYLLEQQILDLRGEVETCKRDRDELEMQMEQLALDYEIMKQEHHDMSYKLEQSELQEQLKLQYECSPSDAIQELESQIENLENDLKLRSKESEDSLVAIHELEAHVKSLEDELEKQAQGFEADLEALTQSKVEQEQRAIRVEETLRKTRWQNAKTAERLQEEFRRLSVQMTSTFEANEKLAAKALAEANELRFQKMHLEQMLQEKLEEHQSVKDDYEARMHKLAGQVMFMKNEIEQLHSEIEDRALQAEETQRLLSDESLKLKEEIETYKAKIIILSDEKGDKETLDCELEKMRLSMKEMELLVEQGNDERTKLESRVMLVKLEAEESRKELSILRGIVAEKELIAGNLQSRIDFLQSQCAELKHSLSEDELEKDKLRKQVSQLKSQLKKKEDALNIMEKKMKDAVKATSKNGKPLPHGSKEVANLKERIKVLEGHIKLKETALETSTNTFLEKEKDLHSKIEELEGRMEELNQSSAQYLDTEARKLASTMEDTAPSCSCESSTSNDKSLSAAEKDSSVDTEHQDGLMKELVLLKEKNELMDEELKEMQERYSEISLKFAEVEGERQQLVMKVRYLKNAKKSS